MDHDSWKQRCQDLLQKFYTRNEKCSGIITFPETDITAQGKPWENVMRTLKKWCENSDSASAKDDTTGIIIRNYDLNDHLDFCKVTDNEKRDYLPLLFNDFEKKFKLHENDQRFLVFNPSNKIILVIRMVDSEQSGELKHEAHLCIDEVNIVCFLLRDELKNSGVIVAGLVTYSEENIHSQNCTRCGNFIVTNKIFNSVEEFEVFWKTFFRENMFEGLAKFLNASENTDTTKVFQVVGSKILGYLTHLQFTPGTLEEPILPITENSPSGNITQAELLLDRYQMEIAYSSEKRILLHGNYGTGKTVVALKKLDLLKKCLKEKEVIYYVNFAAKSRLDCMIKQKFKAYDKVRVLRGGSSLSRIVCKEILPKENKNDTKNIHLIVDEYNSQDLSPDESTKLYKIFTEAEQFKNSTLLIALQPIKIDREDHFYVADKKHKNLQKKHMFGKLKKIMTEYELKYVMRTTIKINTLVEITQKYLSEKSNRYTHSYQLSDNSCGSLNPGGEIVRSISSIASVASSSTATSPSSSSAIIDIDESYKLASTPGKRSEKFFSKTVTRYSYTCDSEIGHGIEGPVPLLIEFKKSYRPKQLMTLIAFLLKKVIKIESKRIAITHFESTNAPWLQQLLQLESCFKGLTLTDDVEKYLANTNDNMVLVNSFAILRGLEFSEVLLILEKDEYYQKQYIPEAITRCTSNLSVLIRPPWKKKHQSNTADHLVNHWKEINNIKIEKEKKPILNLLTLGFCSNKACKALEKNAGCLDSQEYLRFYKIHTHTKWYKGLSEEIEKKIVPSLQLDDKTTEERATAL